MYVVQVVFCSRARKCLRGIALYNSYYYHSVLGSWILTSRQPHRVTSGQITHSKFLYTSSKHKSVNPQDMALKMSIVIIVIDHLDIVFLVSILCCFVCLF